MAEHLVASPTYPGRSLRLRLSVAVWLGFVAYPLVAAYSDPRAGPAHLAVVSAVAALFCGFYIAFCALPDLIRAEMDRGLLAGAVVVLVGAVTFLVFYDRAAWDYSYVYCLWPAIAAAGDRPWPVPLLAGAAVVSGAAAGLGGANLATLALVVAGVGASIYGVTRLVAANETLRRAHIDQAAVAVAEERLRFARDLHELLGHSLSVIALKSQVASRLIADQSDRAEREMVEIEQITRQALQEVRDAVGGYRRPSLFLELEGARRALGSAGITLREAVGRPDLPGGVEVPLAWALREGVTNVVRHSGASNCTITVELTTSAASLAVTDDGVGPVGSVRASPGNGLRGLAERVAELGGSLDTAARAGGGFCLVVSVPLPVATETMSPTVAGAAP